LCVAMAYDAKVNFTDVYSQVRVWDTLIYNDLSKINVVVPPKSKTKKDDKYAGAYVKEPKPGIYDWVVSFDLNSLYPHLIMQYNISPETLADRRHPTATVEGLLSQRVRIDGDFAVCANGAQYRKDIHGFLPQMMQRIYDERTIYKKKMLAAKQQYEKGPTEQLRRDIAKFNNVFFFNTKHSSNLINIDLIKGYSGIVLLLLFSIEFIIRSGIFEMYDNSLIVRFC